MSKRILVPLAKGYEEIEFISPVDVMKRAGFSVIIASVNGDSLVEGGTNGVFIKTDKSLSDVKVDDFDAIVLPGGWDGAMTLASDAKVQSLIKEFKAKGKFIAAICAAPIALDKAGVLPNSWTCYPGSEEHIKAKGYDKDALLVFKDNILTSKGPATAVIFGLEIVKILDGEAKYKELYNGLLVNYLLKK